MCISLLKQQQFAKALDLLRKSEVLCGMNDFTRAMIYNNYACYYRK